MKHYTKKEIRSWFKLDVLTGQYYNRMIPLVIVDKDFFKLKTKTQLELIDIK